MKIENADRVAELAKTYQRLRALRAAAIEANCLEITAYLAGGEKIRRDSSVKSVKRIFDIEPAVPRQDFIYNLGSNSISPGGPKVEALLDLARQMLVAQIDHEIAVVVEKLNALGVTDL